MARVNSTPGELARRGFDDADAAARDLEALAATCHRLDQPGWLDLAEHTADPDLALAGLARLTEQGDCLSGLDDTALRRLAAVLGGSQALQKHLAAQPDDVSACAAAPEPWDRDRIQADLVERIGAHVADGLLVADGKDAADRLRLANKRHLVRIAARDLTSPHPLDELPSVAAELAALSDAIVECALAIARSQVADHQHVRLGVVALGKCGAQELNYISDIDVIFVAEPADEDTSSARAVELGTKLAAKLSQTCSAHGIGGSIWQVDANLRPDGKSGPLVRSLESMQSYYDKWAKNWEFQAMLKARPMAGDRELAQDFVDIVQPRVWQAAERENFLADTQAMRQRVISLIPAAQADREVKLGAGGLRDVEFSAQLLQLVHGRQDESLRVRATLPALQALVAGGYMGRPEGAQLEEAYRFERLLEHRVQLYKLRRTHLLPDDEPGLRVLARGLQLAGVVERGGGEEVVKRWRATARTVLRLHQRVFYSPLLAAVTRLSTDELQLTTDQARDRLRVLGFLDPDAALRHLEALTSGVSRASDIQRQLMPAMLGWFAEGSTPDHALLGFRQLSEKLGTSHWYLRALRDEGGMAERLARILSSSRYAVDLLQRAPESVRLLARDEELAPRSRDELRQALLAAARRHEDVDEAIAAVRALRRAELFRLVAGDLLGVVGLEALGRGLSDLAGATIDATLEVARRTVPDAPALGVVAMGRWGGGEMGLGSDCDAMFVCADSDDPDATRRAGQLVAAVRQLLAQRGPDPALPIDPDLRPEGRNGPVVRTLGSYRAYYQRWSVTWESQALLRAAHGAGDEELTGQLLELVEPERYPAGGLERGQLADIRKLKARMETERIPRGTDPKRNTKLGPGGLSDVEWTVQVLQLQHAHQVPGLRTTSTLAALDAATEAGLVTPEQRDALETAWRLASRLRNKIMLVRGRAGDVLPTDPRDISAMALLLGYGPGQGSQLLDDWRRAARHAQHTVDDLFWGGR